MSEIGNYWQRFAASGSGVRAIAGGTDRLYVTADSGATWTEAQPAGEVDRSWYLVGCSSNGLKLFAGAYGGRLYLSSDGGTTWTETQPSGDADANWGCSACTDDLRIIVAGITNGRLYLSVDYGSTWTEVRPAGDANKAWNCLACSADGVHILAGVSSGRLYHSTDTGTTWTEVQPAGDADKVWYTVSYSADATRAIAGVYGSRLYISDDEGETWSEIRPAGDANANWTASACSGDGSLMLAGTTARLYRSTDAGVTWNEIRPVGDANEAWDALGISANGNYVLAGGSSSQLQLSSDRGSTWTHSFKIRSDDFVWTGMVQGTASSVNWPTGTAMSTDKAYLYVTNQASADKRAWRSVDGGLSWTEMRPDGDVDRNWLVGCDTTGRYVILTSSYNVTGPLIARVYYSTDYGQTFTLTEPMGTKTTIMWRSPHCTTDGATWLISSAKTGTSMGRVFVSSDYGASWSDVSPNGNLSYKVTAVSGDYLYAAVDGGRMYRSTDLGVTWSEVQPGGDADYDWESISVSEDGDVVACGTDTTLYLSTDSGVTWSDRTPAFSAVDLLWVNVSVATDGASVLATGATNEFFLSEDSGVTWTDISVFHLPADHSQFEWNTMADFSGKDLFFASLKSNSAIYLWLGEYDPVVTITVAATSSSGDSSAYAESVAVIPGSTEDEVWVIAKRTINGQTVRYLEQMQPRVVADREDHWFVDSGLDYDGDAETTFSGLDHLEGETVKILADGAVAPSQVVTNGSITITDAASRVIVGLPFRYILKPMRFDLSSGMDTTHGSLKRFAEVVISFYRSSNVKYGVDVDNLFNVDFRTEEAYGSPPVLYTKDKVVSHEGGFDPEDSIVISGDDPLPCTVRAIIARLEVTGR